MAKLAYIRSQVKPNRLAQGSLTRARGLPAAGVYAGLGVHGRQPSTPNLACTPRRQALRIHAAMDRRRRGLQAYFP